MPFKKMINTVLKVKSGHVKKINPARRLRYVKEKGKKLRQKYAKIIAMTYGDMTTFTC